MATPNTILFAIQAGLRLYGAIRKSYVDGTRSRSLVLPLPRSPAIGVDSAVNFFRNLDDDTGERYPRGVLLAEKPVRDPAEDEEVLNLYLAYLSVHQPGALSAGVDSALLPAVAGQSAGSMTDDELSALFMIRQWEKREPGTSTPLQQIAGTLVNVAVDYFLETPGRISDERPEGRALKSFLSAVDRVDFAVVASSEILPGLMIAIVDSVAANPGLFGGGRNEQLFIKNVTTSFAESARQHLAGASVAEREDASAWLDMVARSLVDGGAETVLSNPQRFLGVKDGGETSLVQRVGKTMSDLVIGDGKITFRPLLSAGGLTKVTRSVLDSIAENPELLRIHDDGINSILSAVAGNVATLREPYSKEIFPEVIRLILEKSAENMDALWGRSFKKADRHLLVIATKTLLTEISKKPPNNRKWGLNLSTNQLLGSLDAVLDEVVDNPQWLTKRAGRADSILGEALKAITESLRKVEGSRLTAEAGIAILRSGIGAVAMRIAFLDEAGTVGAGAARTAIGAALDAIFDEVFGDLTNVDRHWKLAQSSALVAVAEAVFEEIAEHETIDAETILLVRTAIREELDSPKPFDPDAFRERLLPAA